MTYFDYESVAEQAGIDEPTLEALRRDLRDEFPHDDMMFELHVLRACMAVRDGLITIDDLRSDVAR